MSMKENIQDWRESTDFFFKLELEAHNKYKLKEISLFERNILLKEINKGWKKSSIENNPFIKNNERLKKIAKRFCD